MLLNPPNRQPGAINRGGLRNARRGAPADPFADLYGTGLGQIPMLLDPLDAVLDGSGNVASIANRGGAGAAFDATATGTGITRTGGLLNVTTGLVGLQLPNAADLVGTRLFIAASMAADTHLTPRFFGRDAVHFGRIHSSTGGLLLSREGVQAFVTGSAPGTAIHLFEIELAAGLAKFFVDGVLRGTTAAAWTDFLIPLIFTAGAIDGFTGLAGVISSVITDGTPALDPVMLRVRQTLAGRYGIAVA